jgi:peptidoglycan/LPS O-acetylase OafA/YrhL
MDPSLKPLSAKAGERSNWDILSFLRFFLALIVAATHLDEYSPHPGVFHWIAKLGAFEAILGFLLISGYSIGNSIQKESQGFFRRRMLRIYPVYLTAIVIAWLVQRDPFTGTFAWMLVLNLFFLGQLFINYSYVGVAWSLCLEVWLYALGPVFIRCRALTLEVLIVLSFICYALYTCGRTFFHWSYYSETIGGVNLPCLAFIWITGFYLATSKTGKKRPLYFAGLLFIGHFLLSVGIQFIHDLKHRELRNFFYIDSIDFLFAGLLLAAIYLIFLGVISHWFHFNHWQRVICRFLGDISYPLYLVHVSVFKFLTPYTNNAWLLVLAAMALASAVYFCCDFYSRRRKLA